MASLVVYVFFSDMYFAKDKRAPMFDFCFTVVIAVFWLSASAAWANGVITMKYSTDPDNFLFDKVGYCHKNENGFDNLKIKSCTVDENSLSFKEANISIVSTLISHDIGYV